MSENPETVKDHVNAGGPRLPCGTMAFVSRWSLGPCCAELSPPFTGPGTLGPVPKGRVCPKLRKDGPTPHRRHEPLLGSTLQLTLWLGTQVNQP